MEDFKFQLGNFVSVALNRPAHILKNHNINLNIEQIIRLADQTQGQEGIHVFNSKGSSIKTIVIRGTYEENGKRFGIFRTMWLGNEGSNQQNRGGLPVIYHHPKIDPICKTHGAPPYSHGFCQFCN